jgi:hypothetical protein
MKIVREFLDTSTGEKGEKGEKPPSDAPTGGFSPFSPFSPTPGLAPSHPIPPLLELIQAWDPDHARREMEAADALVERLHVRGTDPVIVEAAARTASAYYAHDLPGVIAGCTDVCRRARELVAGRRPGGRGAARAVRGRAAT